MSAFDSPLVSGILGTELNTEKLRDLSTRTRLDYVEALAQNLGQYVQKSEASAAQNIG